MPMLVHIGLLCIYFESFGVEHVPMGVEKFIGHKNIKPNIFKINESNVEVFPHY